MISKNNDRGVIMIFAAAFISVMLMLAGIAFFILQRATAKEQWGSVWNVIGLAGIQEYFNVQCEDLNLTGQACHQKKFEEAIVRMQEISDANSHLVTSLKIYEKGTSEPPGNFLEVTPGLYFFKQITDNQNDCAPDPYPCFKPRTGEDPNELANAFRIRGKVKHGRLTHFIFNNFTGGSKSVDLEIERTVTAVPLAVGIVIDMSPSIQRINHPYKANRTVTDPINSNFAYQFFYSGSGYVTPEAEREKWNELEMHRPPENKPWTFHYKDDYRPFEVYNDNSDFNSYPDRTHHIDPQPGASSDDQYYILDAHRSIVSGYKGPEPYLSIVKGARKALDLVRDRNVSGDSVTLISYDSHIPWKYGIKRTTNFEYLERVLDGAAFESNSQHPGYPIPPVPSSYPMSLTAKGKNDNSVPLLIRLGLFPTPGKWTDTIQGFSMAVNQMSEGLGEVPTVKAIMHFTDGLINCSSSEQNKTQPDGFVGRCRESYTHYNSGMKDLTELVQTNLAENGIALHTFMVGNAAHYLAIPSGSYNTQGGYGPDPGAGSCLTDSEARSMGIDYVAQQFFADDNQAEGAFAAKNEVPFYRAAYDSFVLTRMTGGRWGALLPVADNCTPAALDCTNPAVAWQKVTHDPLCRSIEDQVSDYIEDVILNSKTFAVVD